MSALAQLMRTRRLLDGDHFVEVDREPVMAQAKKKGSLWVGRVDRESRAREGERIELAVSTRRLHFFDPETGRGIYDDAEVEE